MIALGAVRALLGRVPMLAWALMAALAWGAFQRHQVTVERAGKLKAVQELADVRLAAAQTTVTVLTKTMAGQQETLHAAELATANEERARGAVTAALSRVLSGVRTADRARAHPTPAASSPAAEARPAVCPDVLGRVGEAAERIAAEAGRYRIAGAKCEADYEAAEWALKAAKP